MKFNMTGAKITVDELEKLKDAVRSGCNILFSTSGSTKNGYNDVDKLDIESRVMWILEILKDKQEGRTKQRYYYGFISNLKKDVKESHIQGVLRNRDVQCIGLMKGSVIVEQSIDIINDAIPMSKQQDGRDCVFDVIVQISNEDGTGGIEEVRYML